MESAYAGESWTTYIKSTRMLAIVSIIERSQPLVFEGIFSPGFVLVSGVVTASITVSYPASVFIRRSRLFFLYVRTSSIRSCKKYVQQ